MKIIMGSSGGPDEHHGLYGLIHMLMCILCARASQFAGCPFKTFDANNLAKALKLCSLSDEAIRDIVEAAKKENSRMPHPNVQISCYSFI